MPEQKTERGSNFFAKIKDKWQTRSDDKLGPEEKEAKKLAELIKQRFQNHPLQGMELQKRAVMRAWYYGNQSMILRKQASKTEIVQVQEKDPTTGREKHRSKMNILRPNGRISIAKLTKDEPKTFAIPVGFEDKDRKAARMSNYLLENFYSRMDLDLTGLDHMALELAYINGTSWYCPKWNPDACSYSAKPGSPVFDGDVEIDVRDDHEIFVDPAKSWFRSKWGMIAYMADVEAVKEVAKVTAPDLVDKIVPFERDAMTESRYQSYTRFFEKNEERVKGKCFCIDYYERPSKDHPQGRNMLLVNETLPVKFQENQYGKFGYLLSLPMIPIYWFKNFDSPYGDAALPDQMPLQNEVNNFMTLIYNAGKMTGHNMIAVGKGSNLKNKRVEAMSGNFVETADGKMQPYSAPTFPQYISNHINFLINANNNLVAGIGESAYAEIPTGGSRISGAALKQLNDAIQARMAPQMRSYNVARYIRDLFLLNCYRHNITTKRWLKVVDRGNQWELQEFNKSDLSSGNWDLILKSVAGYSSSPVAKIELMINMWDRKIPQAAEQGDQAALKYMKMLEFGQIEEVMELQKLHRNRAEWTYGVMEKATLKKVVDPVSGEEVHTLEGVPDLYPTDDMRIHLEVYTMKTLDKEFEDMEFTRKQAIMERIALIKSNLNPPQGASSGTGQTPPQQTGSPVEEAMAEGGTNTAAPAAQGAEA